MTKSPEHIRLSLAAAMTLGLKPGSFYRGARLHCLNLLLTYPGGCRARCTYCGLAQNGKGGGSQSFIRVDWPVYSFDEILNRAGSRTDVLERVCISMIMHPSALDDTVYLVEKLVLELKLPVSVLVNPSSIDEGDMEKLSGAGVDMVAIAVDAATGELFERHRGNGAGGPHNWDLYWKTLSDAAMVFGRDKFGCHLIAGLGETEREMVKTIERVRIMGGQSHMFAFHPETGSALEQREPCDFGSFRRIQLARYLIDYDIVDAGRIGFDDRDRIVSFGLAGADLDDLVKSGMPFMTSGCRGKTRDCACNRPYGDGPPSSIRSFPFELNARDIQLVQKQMATYSDVGRKKTKSQQPAR